MSDLPPYVQTTRRDALNRGAVMIEREIRYLRAQAMSADGRPYGQQYEVDPVPEAERIMLATLELAQAATMLREMARHEAPCDSG